jgi:signal peptidase I
MDNIDNNEPIQKKKSGARDFIDSLLIAFVIAMVIRTFLFSAYKIPSGSMLDTLLIGDHIIASKLSYIIGKPKFGDIAVFEYPIEPDKDYIKRVIGTPGDTIRIIDKRIYRNGEAMDETYAKFSTYSGSPQVDNVAEFTVPEGMYLMLGDNRDSSFDSRFWGFVPERAFKGKSLFVYFSKEQGGGIRWSRFLHRTK